MAERVYPSSKPSNPPPQPQTQNVSSFPAPKSHLYNTTRPTYRPQPKPRPRRRNCCCLCFLWTILFFLALIFLAAIASAVIWVLYRPQRPSFSVSALRLSSFNLSSSHLSSHLDLNISARNPNKKLIFFYDPISISVSSNSVDVGDGTFPSFIHGTKNTTVLIASISTVNRDLDSGSVSSLQSDLKRNNGLPLEIELDTKVRVKMGGLKTMRVRIRVSCDGINAPVPKGKSTAMAVSSDLKCKVKLRIKIWKWEI
ncbi:late embryogenesis abundant (LEA) hydroxyproline-rich glycoprotein family [Tasmannia lanceolata]|uniref:late embryogenesis abundant (LEA) hydroxyproline-rich glycoprotein family n=1 Tax=Tasmannia lanceolata TaxID=3420 RepID=UPI004064B58F